MTDSEHTSRGSGQAAAVSAGKLKVVTTYLEMRQPPARPLASPPTAGVTVIQATHPTVSFYRYLYDTVGEQWLWYERRKMSDEALRAVIHDPKVELYVLYVRGVPAGYAELDRRTEDDVEVAYFGLMPEFIGRGLGPYLLERAVVQAWCQQPKRVWVHTCNLDHPKALEVYQRMGFVAYKQETIFIDDPRA
ncbi:MAG: GNAT family N-acetyltransferase [Acidiferrobacterales bacterium]